MKNYHKILIALTSSILLTIAWPVWGYPIFMFFAFVPLLWLEDRIAQGEKGRVFWMAFLTFFVWNVATTWWVWNATPAAIAAWLLNALFMGIVFWLFRLVESSLLNLSHLQKTRRTSHKQDARLLG